MPRTKGWVTNLAQDLRIPKDDNAVLRPRQGNIQPPGIIQEPDSLMLVAPDTTQDDVILLPPLERVDARHFDLLVQILPQGTVELHVADDVRPLAFVWGNDTNLIWHNARFEEFCDNLLHV